MSNKLVYIEKLVIFLILCEFFAVRFVEIEAAWVSESLQDMSKYYGVNLTCFHLLCM